MGSPPERNVMLVEPPASPASISILGPLVWANIRAILSAAAALRRLWKSFVWRMVRGLLLSAGAIGMRIFQRFEVPGQHAGRQPMRIEQGIANLTDRAASAWPRRDEVGGLTH